MSSSAVRNRKDESETEPGRIFALKRICDLLLAGGYFRVRITSLSPFDKVVGGICWSITASGSGVDVDLFFQEQLQIGQRIELSERLCEVLQKFKGCPNIEPHEIHGLNYDRLFPVIQFLVKQVLQTRRLTGDLVRTLALGQFSKSEATHIRDGDADVETGPRRTLGSIQSQFSTNRKFRKAAQSTLSSIEDQTDATLLEYGDVTAVLKDEEDEKEKKQTQEQIEAKQKLQQEQKEHLEALQASMSDVGGNLNKLSGSSVGNIMMARASEISAQNAEYEEAVSQAGGEGAIAANAKDSKLQQHLRQKKNLTRKKEAMIAELSGEKKAQYQGLKQASKEAQGKLGEAKERKQRIEEEIQKLIDLEASYTPEQKATLQQLKDMVFLNETLKKQEKQFKESCMKELEKLKNKIKALKMGDASADEDEDEELKRMREVERIYNADLEKLNKIRAILAKKNQEIAAINREIDEVPTRAELIQFERRFKELYELVAEKLLETRKYYALYNTLDESYRFMTSEVELLNSITEGFPRALVHPDNKVSFSKQVSDILQGVHEQIERSENELQAEQAIKQKTRQEHATLVEEQRLYYHTVKLFQEECDKNTQLLEALEARGQ